MTDRAAWSQQTSQIQGYLPWPIRYESQFHPQKEEILAAIKNPDTVVYLADGHGNQTEAIVRESKGNDDDEGRVLLKVYPDIHNPDYDPEQPISEENKPGAMDLRPNPIGLVVMTHCYGMDRVGDRDNWAYAFSKGQQTGSVIIGVKQGLGDGTQWAALRMYWMPAFFHRAFGWYRRGQPEPDCETYTFWQAFRETNLAVWGKVDWPYLEFYGDKNLTWQDLL